MGSGPSGDQSTAHKPVDSPDRAQLREQLSSLLKELAAIQLTSDFSQAQTPRRTHAPGAKSAHQTNRNTAQMTWATPTRRAANPPTSVRMLWRRPACAFTQEIAVRTRLGVLRIARTRRRHFTVPIGANRAPGADEALEALNADSNPSGGTQ
jgi:hypothetical protein